MNVNMKGKPLPQKPCHLTILGEEDFVVLTSPFLSMLVTVNDFCF